MVWALGERWHAGITAEIDAHKQRTVLQTKLFFKSTKENRIALKNQFIEET